MAFLVYGESGVEAYQANSYVTTDEADTYFDDRFNLVWPTAPSPEAALVKATAFIDAKYRGRWKGTKVETSPTASLAWPRTGVVDEDGYEVPEDEIPRQVKEAVFEAAVRTLSGELFIDWSQTGAVTSESVTVGPISESKSYSEPLQGKQPVYKIIDELLSGLIIGGGDTAYLSRA